MTTLPSSPDTTIDPKKTFGIHLDSPIPAFSTPSDFVPTIDKNYCFDPETTRSILAGFTHNRRVLVQGYHGTGKSTHIEQIAARLNWPCMRINLDGHISRMDLVGKDAIVLKEGKQVTEFKEGIIPWSISHPVALVLDEYDAARPDVMFVIQRLLESEGKFTLIDRNEVITPHPYFRLFATSNTVGLGNTSGLYHGVQLINQGQMDRWNIVTTLNYLPTDKEIAIIIKKVSALKAKKKLVSHMVKLAELTRSSFAMGDISTVMSPRTVLAWAENLGIFGDTRTAFKVSFYNKCDEEEKPTIAEFYQRCFGEELVCID